MMNIKFSDLRQKMVNNQIRTVNVTQHSVLSAFLNIPREDFVPQDFRDFAYLDEDIILTTAQNKDFARYAMAPVSLARLIQLADVSNDDVVLDIGANIGYCAAILSLLAKFVIALESDTTLARSAEKVLAKNNYDNIIVITESLTAGYAAKAPYDVIFIEGAVDFIPKILFGQMREGSRLVVVEGRGNSGEAHLYVRQDSIISIRNSFNLAAKLLPHFRKKNKFTF